MSWSVHSTMDEPVELVSAFVAYYLSMGAAEVHLCLDRRNDEIFDTLGTIPQVHLTVCDDAYWSRTRARKRPISQADRQVINLKNAYASSRHDWLLFCDADEFLYSDPGGPCLTRILERCSRDVLFHTFPVAERFYAIGENYKGIFDGLYRCRSPRVQEIGPDVYGDKWNFLSRGLLQDGPGKSIMRVGTGLDVNIHAPTNPQKATPEQLALFEGIYLLHYDGLTPFHWALKLVRWYCSMIDLLGDDEKQIRKRRTSGRNRQAEFLHRNRHDPAALIEMTDLQRLRAEQIAHLAVAGGIPLVRPDIEAAAHHVFPDLDFSQESFDRKLRILHSDFISSSGFDYRNLEARP